MYDKKQVQAELQKSKELTKEPVKQNINPKQVNNPPSPNPRIAIGQSNDKYLILGIDTDQEVHIPWESITYISFTKIERPIFLLLAAIAFLSGIAMLSERSMEEVALFAFGIGIAFIVAYAITSFRGVRLHLSGSNEDINLSNDKVEDIIDWIEFIKRKREDRIRSLSK